MIFVRARVIEVLPAPVRPTTPIFSVPIIFKLIFSKQLGRSALYLNEASLNIIDVDGFYSC